MLLNEDVIIEILRKKVTKTDIAKELGISRMWLYRKLEGRELTPEEKEPIFQAINRIAMRGSKMYD